MKFGGIDNTVFGFGETQDDEPCFCWLQSSLKIEVFGGGHSRVVARGKTLKIEASHKKWVFCSKDVQPIEKFSSRFIAGNYVGISWDIYKMCGPCKEVPGGTYIDEEQSFGCSAQSLLCSEEMDDVPDTYGPPGKRWRLYNSPAQNLWRLRWDLKQKEAEVKSICKEIRKMFEKCKFDMACKQTKKICELDPTPGSGG